jgi:hypothetical protein
VNCEHHLAMGRTKRRCQRRCNRKRQRGDGESSPSTRLLGSQPICDLQVPIRVLVITLRFLREYRIASE